MQKRPRSDARRANGTMAAYLPELIEPPSVLDTWGATHNQELNSLSMAGGMEYDD